MHDDEKWLERGRKRIALGEQLYSTYLPRELDLEMIAHFSWLLGTTEADDAARALVIVGDSHVGKSSLLKRAICNNPILGAPHSANEMPIVALELDSVANDKLLGNELVRASGYPIVKDVGANAAWSSFGKRLEMLGTKLVWIDEADQAALMPKQGRFEDEQYVERVTNRYKGILKKRRVAMVLSGLPKLEKFIRSDVQVAGYCRFVTIERLGNADVSYIENMINGLAGSAEINAVEIMQTDIVARLMFAADHIFGIAFRLTVEAVLQAAAPLGIPTKIPPAARKLDASHFAVAYGDHVGRRLGPNPFLGENWKSQDRQAATANKVGGAG